MSDKARIQGNVGLVLAAVVAVALGLGSAWWMAQPDTTVSQYERLGAEIGCQCGTCPMRPIATCGCGFADGMLGELRTLVDEGHDDDEVMATFAARYGDAVRIKPASSGLDLTAWAVLADFPAGLIPLDLAWGMTLCTLVSGGSLLIARTVPFLRPPPP